MENMGVWTQKYDMSTADQKSQEILGKLQVKMQRIASNVQNVSEVAELVKNIILSEKPNLRYQTNEKHSPDEVKAKLVDPTGNNLVQLLKKKYLDEE